MHFFQLLRSLDEALFEVMGWLLFYPITLWRTMVHPLRTMALAEREADDSGPRRYEEMLSPPLFLLLTLVLSHVLELQLIGDSPIVMSKVGLAGLVSDDTSLLLLRLFAFAVFPVLTAAWLLRCQGVKITRTSLERPFYAQCYLTAPYALAYSFAAILLQVRGNGSVLSGAGIAIVATVLYLRIQSKWFARHLGTRAWRALPRALAAYFACYACLIGLGLLMSDKSV